MAEAQRIVATIMGCGSSGGVPRIGGGWGVCDPNEPRNRRRRCSLLIEGYTGDAPPTRIVIDTGCDLREQLLDADVDRVDAVLFTHEHADHTHGIDDLRVLALNMGRRVDVYFAPEAGQRIVSSFAYCFTALPGSGYPPILTQHHLTPNVAVTISGPGGDITIIPFLQEHGEITSLGFRVDDFAYSCDLSGIPAHSAAAVSGLSLWVMDALKPTPHPSHLSLPEALELVAHYQPAQAVLTNLHVDLDYRAVDTTTADHITPAFDGMRIDIRTGTILNR